jgi:hypothetical protein
MTYEPVPSSAVASKTGVWPSPTWSSRDVSFEKSAFMTAEHSEDPENGSHYSLDLSEPDDMAKEEQEYMLMLRNSESHEEDLRLSRHALFWIIVTSITVVLYFVLIGWLVVKGIDSASEMEYD